VYRRADPGDWWDGFVELITAMDTRWVNLAVEPAQSEARL
jgi:hypothetical protein